MRRPAAMDRQSVSVPATRGDLRQHGFHYLRLYGEEDDCRRHRQLVD